MTDSEFLRKLSERLVARFGKPVDKVAKRVRAIATRLEVKAPAQMSGAFQVWYDLYPRKIDKPAAWRAWVSRGCEDSPHLVVAGLRRWLPVYAKLEAEKIPHPSTWLNGRRWEDQPEKAIAPRPTTEPAALRTIVDAWKGTQATAEELEGLRRGRGA